MKKYCRNQDLVNAGDGNATQLDNDEEPNNKVENLQFYYHPDHLGSSSYITDVSGEVYQHMEYFPFGETFIEERTDAEYTSYLYNGKELDEETGLYYYGARYYDPRISMWYGVDPHSEKYPDVSPFNYVFNNPLIHIDPNGKDGLMVVDKQSKTITIKARYYVQTSSPVDFKGYSCKDLLKMQKTINSRFNKEVEGLTISEGDYKGYSLNFDLEFIEGGTIHETEKMAEEDFIGNSLTVLDSDQSFPIVENEDGTTSTVGGKTEKNKKILMNKKEDNRTNRMHEILHTLGLKDAHKGGPQEGKMKYPPGKINQNDINEMINDENLYKF